MLLTLPALYRIEFQVEQVQTAHTMLGVFKNATLLIHELEKFRDLSVLNFLGRDLERTKAFERSKQQVLTTASSLLEGPLPNKYKFFLKDLSEKVERNKVFPGNEGASVKVLFDNANLLVERAYLWRLKFAYQYIAHTGDGIRPLIELANDSYFYFNALGISRTVGSFYLEKAFIDSSGIELLDKSQQNIIRLVSGGDAKRQQYESSRIDIAPHLLGLEHALTSTSNLVDRDLLHVIALTADDNAFFDEASALIRSAQSHVAKLTNMMDNELAKTSRFYNDKILRFYLWAAVISALLIYCFSGFYRYSREAITSLINGAQNVAAGDLEYEIAIDSQDELKELASAMNDMRLDIKQREDQLTLLSQTDGLTQLKNRNYLDQFLPIALANANRNKSTLAVIMLDIDHFKRINDHYGHQAGDECIRKVSSLFKSQFRRKNDIVARYGGEEFVAVVSDLDANKVYQQTEQLRQKIAETTIFYEGEEIELTASFGVASCLGKDNSSPEKLLAFCDSLLYQAKHGGRNQIVTGSFPLCAVG